jgi:hypothetical protein
VHCNSTGRLVEVQELVALERPPGHWSVQRIERDIGENDVGIVSWLMTLKTPECPQGRQVTAVELDQMGGGANPARSRILLMVVK